MSDLLNAPDGLCDCGECVGEVTPTEPKWNSPDTEANWTPPPPKRTIRDVLRIWSGA